MRPKRSTLGLAHAARTVLAVYLALLLGGMSGTLARAAYFSDATQTGALYIVAFVALFAGYVYVSVKYDL